MISYEFLTIYYNNKPDLFRVIALFEDTCVSRLNLVCNQDLDLQMNSKNIRIIKNDSNVGFSKAINKGLKIIYEENTFKFLIIFNLDVYFDVKYIEKELLSISTKNIYNPLVQLENITYTRLYFMNYRSKYSTKKLKKYLEYPNLSFFIIGNDAIKLYLDERYFMYFEDVELGFNLAKKNIPINVAENIKIFRKKNESNSEINRIDLSMRSSKIYFSNKSQFFYFLYLLIMKIRKIKYALYNYLWN